MHIANDRFNQEELTTEEGKNKNLNHRGTEATEEESKDRERHSREWKTKGREKTEEAPKIKEKTIDLVFLFFLIFLSLWFWFSLCLLVLPLCPLCLCTTHCEIFVLITQFFYVIWCSFSSVLRSAAKTALANFRPSSVIL
jgi:hypothetical protein